MNMVVSVGIFLIILGLMALLIVWDCKTNEEEIARTIKSKKKRG
jgi:hypothetical protein